MQHTRKMILPPIPTLNVDTEKGAEMKAKF